MRKKFLTKSW